MAVIETVAVNAVARTDKFVRGMKKARDSSKRLRKETKLLSGGFSRLQGGLAALGLGISTGGFIAFLKGTTDSIDKLNKTAGKLGLTTDALSELGFVAERTGVNQQTFEMGLQRMTRRIAEAAKGSGEALPALKELGVDIQALASGTPDAALEAIADAMSGVKNESDKLRLAFKLFDSEGVALVNTLRGGSRGIRTLREEAKALGATIEQDAANQVTELADSLTNLKTALTGAGNALTIQLAGPLQEFLEGVKALLQAQRELSRQAPSNQRMENIGIGGALRQAVALPVTVPMAVGSAVFRAGRTAGQFVGGNAIARQAAENVLRSGVDTTGSSARGAALDRQLQEQRRSNELLWEQTRIIERQEADQLRNPNVIIGF